MANLEKLVEDLSGLTLLEAAELTKMLEEKWGVSAAAPMAMMAAGPVVAGGPAEEEEEKTEFNVALKEIGPKKIQVIKAVRAVTALGLKEAKDVVEAALSGESIILEAVSKEVAEDAKSKLEAEGAVVAIQ
jgi:large subunit ribosomal protein L7/L12